jgi:vancomycin resistance protein YoaR
VKGGALSLWRTRGNLGAEPDMGWILARAARGDAFVPLKLRVNKNTATLAMRRLAPKFARKLRDARILDKPRGMQIVPEIVGQTLNLGGSVPRLAQAFERDAALREVAIMVRKQEPRRTRADFKGIDGRLATFSTDYNSGIRGRTVNMKVAARAIDGAIVKPGATFSLNDTVGERTRKRGYQAAMIFVDGKKKVDLGGGVSQITGTLFNAALLAGLPIASYQTHSRPVTYLPLGRDATVSWGNFDMKFKNSTGAPLYITYRVQGGTATASIFGKRTPGQKVKLRVTSRELGERKINANLYRTIYKNGKPVLKQKVGSSAYRWKEDDQD